MRSALFSCLVLAACSGADASNPLNRQAQAEQAVAKARAADASAVKAGFAPDQPAPLKVPSVDAPTTSAPGATLPPADAAYRYLGRWAVTPRLCQESGWQFQTRKLSAVGKTSCDLPEVSVTPTGYELRGTCRSGRRQAAETIRLHFDERRKRMRVEGQTLGPADLLYCGP